MDTVIYNEKELSADREKLLYAAKIIREGGVAVIPTETVYGLAARADKEGFEALDALKNRAQAKFYSLHISQPEDLPKYVPEIGIRADKLIKNFWPGPVTVVFNLSRQQLKRQKKALPGKWLSLYQNNSLGVRCPSTPITSRLLELSDVPIVATSANLSTQPPATDFQQAYEFFKGKVPLMIDAGKCEEAIGSTVVRSSGGSLDILREGAIDIEEIEDVSKVDIIFVCSTNTCCSPIAAEICKRVLASKIGCDTAQLEMFGYKIRSAGVMVPIEQPPRDKAIRLGKGLGFDLSAHISTPLQQRDVLGSDLIMAMEADHIKRITDFYPHLAEKCRLLGGEFDICDPADGGEKVYEKFAELVENAINDRIGDLL